MGNKGSKAGHKHQSVKKKEKEELITRFAFEFLGIIGRGGFGKVWKVYSRKYKRQYAMKEMSKAKIIDKKSDKSVKAERDLLSIMHHPFIINMHFSFQDNDNLYIAMDLLTGGDLRYHICKNKKFTEAQAKFFIACVILSLEYCHVNNILHRDLKPENLVLDAKGYVRLTDFGIAKIYQKDNHRETSGTPGYMAPEVMCAQNHTIAVDYFALGVMGYELMMGYRPYLGKSRKEIKEKMMAKQASVKLQELPKGWSKESLDFINRLLQRKPANRLGLRGPSEVKGHEWFKYYPWKDLYNMRLQAPFVPKMGDNFDFKYCNAPDKLGINTQERYHQISQSVRYVEAFQDFYYFNRYSMKESKNAPQVGEKYRLLVIQNPHNVYNDDYDDSENNHGENESHIDSKNRSIILTNRLGIEDDKYSTLRRGNSSASTTTLLKEYRNNSSFLGGVSTSRGLSSSTLNHTNNNFQIKQL